MILIIDTAQELGTVALSKNGEILFFKQNQHSREHATWLHQATAGLLAEAKKTVRDLVAIAVVAGPGSYTGIRVGMAAAKGFCFALKVPLITHNSLEVMAEAMRAQALGNQALICPMIDARRDEVFTAIYQSDMQEVVAPQALILDKNSFENQLYRNIVLFFGSGAEKWKVINHSSAALFETQYDTKQALAHLSELAFTHKTWADPIYSEPIYLKEFFSY